MCLFGTEWLLDQAGQKLSPTTRARVTDKPEKGGEAGQRGNEKTPKQNKTKQNYEVL